MIEHRLILALTVKRPGYTTDSAGGRTVAFADAGTIRAQVSQPSVEERAVAAQLGAKLTHIVYTSRAADVQRGDELDGTLPSDVDGRLRVLAVVSNSRSTYKRLECEAVQHGA